MGSICKFDLDTAGLQRGRSTETDLKNTVLAALLLGENFQGFGSISRSYDTVGNFTRNYLGCREITGSRERDKVSER